MYAKLYTIYSQHVEPLRVILTAGIKKNIFQLSFYKQKLTTQE